jgi:long-chain acyl-CoA synthetase
LYPGRHALDTPDKAATVMAGSRRTVTYGELDRGSIQLARAWRRMGLEAGDHVALISENHPRFHEVYWAAARSGLYLTPINRHLSVDEAEYIVEDCGARSLVVSGAMSRLAAGLEGRLTRCEHRLMFDGTAAGYESYEDALAAEPIEPLDDQPRGSLMCYSSGTTGRPKGVKRSLSGRQIDDPASMTAFGLFVGTFAMGPDTVYLSPAPLYHAAPLAYTAAVHSVGGTAVVMESFDPHEALRHLERYEITHSQWVPTMFVRMLKLPPEVRHGVDLSRHRCAIHAAAPCPVEVKHQMIDWWGPIIWEYYGGTEGSGITMIDSEQWLAHPGSVGTARLGTIHICDDDGVELPAGQAGTVFFERDEIAFEYHGDEARTRAAQHPDHETWSSLGDIGQVDENGFLYLRDRKEFMIISGGVNIYPREVEDCFVMHPKVADVAVFGIPDPDMGEAVHAVIQLEDGVEATDEVERELIAHAREAIAHFKVPRRIDFLDELPRSATGKMHKAELRDRYAS